MSKHRILESRVIHTPAGFLVFNAGASAEVPDDLVDRFVEEGVIAGGKVGAADTGQDDRLAGLSNSKLRELAAAKGVEVPANANKTVLLETLRAAGITSPVDGAASDGGVTSPSGPDAPPAS